MRRRDFLTVLGGATAWPSIASAQQPAIPIIGFLESGSRLAFADRLVAFHQGLRKFGYAEGQNVVIEYRFAQGQYDQLPAMATDLVQRQVAVLVATGSPNSAQAAKAATQTIPIVFANGGDPIGLGLVTSISRPVGNLTGLSFYNSSLVQKRVEVARELVPSAKLLGVLVNPNNPNTPSDIKAIQSAVQRIGLQALIVNAASENDFETGFAAFAQGKADVIFVNNDAFFSTRANQIVAFETRYAIPTIYYLRDFVVAGGLVSYGTNIIDIYGEAGVYTGRILKGVKPSELPVLLPSKFEFVVNLGTAKKLGLAIPTSILLRADEVIE
jgi:putative tryptophan/tyrosine transport system substrate-binding protein